MRLPRSLFGVFAVSAVVGLALVVAPLSAAAAATLSGTVSGQLSGQEAKPVAGATVTVTESGSSETFGSTTTGAGGEYSIELPAGVFDVEVTPKPGGPFEATTIHKVEVASSRTLSVILVASKAVHLAGTLRNAQGEPLSGVSVVLVGSPSNVGTETATDGSYSIAAVPGKYHLTISGHGGPSLPHDWVLFIETFDFDSDLNRDITLPQTSTLTVEVLGTKGAPMPNATVRLPSMMTGEVSAGGFEAVGAESIEATGHTGEDGRVSFTVFTGSSRFSGHGIVEPPAESGYGFTNFEPPTVVEDTTVVVHPTPAVHLAGTLRNAQGEPLSGVSVVLVGSPSNVGTETATDGSYSIAAVPGKYHLTISGHGGPSLPHDWVLFIETFDFDSDLNRDITLPQTSTLTVEVLGTKGAPMPNATVRLPSMMTGEVSAGGFEAVGAESIEATGHTGEDGRVSFTVFTGSSRFSGHGIVEPPAESGYGFTNFEPPTVVEDTTVVVHPTPAVHLAGTLRNAQGEPLSGVSVVLVGSPSNVGTETATDGSYSIAAVPGKYHLTISGHGGPSLPHDWVLFIETFDFDSDLNRDITLPQTSTLTVEVLGTKGAPMPNATVRLPSMMTGEVSAGGFEAVGAESIEATGHTGEDGRVSFTVFTGSSRFSGHGIVEPPAESGYGFTNFEPPTVVEDTTVVVSLAGSEGGEEDTEAPRLTSLAIEPGEVDTSGSKQPVILTAHITDDIPGFKEGVVSFVSPSGESSASGGEFKRVSGTETDGVYEVMVTFAQFSEVGAWEIEAIRLTDHAGNEAVLGRGQIEEMELSHTVFVNTQPPAVTGVAPGAGSEAGGAAVQISGTGFSSTSEVRFGSNAATETSVKSPTSITAVAPAGSGTVDVTVTTPGGTSATSPADRFRYSPPVSLTSTPNPSIHGQKVTFSAKVLPLASGAPAPLGTIAFLDGSTVLKVANLSKGAATFSTTGLGAGKHTIVAEYSGDPYFGPGSSEALSQTVSRASTELTLTSSLNPAPYGSADSLKATVKAVAPGAGTPTGTVTFSEGSTVLATVQLSGATAKYPLISTPPGSHEIAATYSGDPNSEASGSSFTQQVVKASTELSLTSSLNPAPYGSSRTIKATVRSLFPGGGSPAGTVTFSEDSTVLATVPLAAGSAQYALKSMTPGSHSITATYNGDADYEASEGVIAQSITKASTVVTLTSTKNPAPFGSSGSLKATVKAVTPGGGTPTGTVTFSEASTALATIPLSGSAASYPLKSLSVGTHEITAAYNGSANYELSDDLISQVITP